MPRINRNVLPLALGVAIGLAFGTAHGVFASRAAALGGDLPWKDARLLAEVLESVKQNYVMPVGDHQMLRAAIRGMVASLDPYSEYLDRDEYAEIKISSSGEYTGVGLELSIQDDQVVVVAPFEGSPAAAAGIRPGDVIATIDGMAVNTANLAETIDRMRGKRGTTVRIGILRGDNSRPLQFPVKRERVELHSVRANMLAPGFGYLRIAEFSDTTGDQVTQALQTLSRRNGTPLKGLVVDLRDNPGGVLEAAVAVADDFLDKGVIVTAKGRTPDSNFQMNATPGDMLAGAPIVVLVDGGSASAAEIVAGALKDHHRAVLMGRRTFGKGSVQSVMPLPGGGALKLTTSLYYTPSGVSINHKGIAPDIELPRDSHALGAPQPAGARADPQVKRALEELRLQSVAARAALSAAAVGP
ncbi:MAG TPA: S41 family peptidase [Steroidobacteraceae bacterium]|nr:S41 family peptidase [Steroidobacteraceae bacterium]